MEYNFRGDARKALEKAREELYSGDDTRLKYAALELRLAIEAITYNKAQSYQNELPSEEYGTWQPRKLMQLLLEIDPKADIGSAISIGVEEEYGKSAKEVEFLGKEETLTLNNIKQHYDALGYYLHMPTANQLSKNIAVDSNKLRKRCEDVIDIIAKVLESHIYNINIGRFASIECVRCSAIIRKRIHFEQSKIEAKCLECKASYAIRVLGENQITWIPIGQEISCPNPNTKCEKDFFLFNDEIRPGTGWQCNSCGMNFRLVIRIDAETAKSL